MRDLARLVLEHVSKTRSGQYRFSFQQIVLLRVAKGLVDTGIRPTRVRKALDRLQDQLPIGRSLTGVRITAERGDIVVQAGERRWEPESGQRLLALDVEELARRAAPLAARVVHDVERRRDDLGPEAWFEIGCELEATSAEEAMRAYEKALELEGSHVDAHLNLGRLFHEAGALEDAESHYRRGLELRPSDPIGSFNLGVVLEDQRRLEPARQAYECAIHADPSHADAFFNLAGVYEALGRPKEAIRHLNRYRQLIGTGATRLR